MCSHKWTENVQKGRMPDPDGSEAADNAIRKRYLESEEKSILLTGFDEELRRRKDILELQGKLEREKKEIEQKIKLYMEDAEKAENDHYTVTWKTISSNRVDSKKLKENHPDIYQKCLKPSASRRFEIKEIK